jgi:hypothetical protein
VSVWAAATEVAIWTLILGSLAVFGWFLVEVARLARSDRDRRHPPPDSGPPST